VRIILCVPQISPRLAMSTASEGTAWGGGECALMPPVALHFSAISTAIDQLSPRRSGLLRQGPGLLTARGCRDIGRRICSPRGAPGSRLIWPYRNPTGGAERQPIYNVAYELEAEMLRRKSPAVNSVCERRPGNCDVCSVDSCGAMQFLSRRGGGLRAHFLRNQTAGCGSRRAYATCGADEVAQLCRYPRMPARCAISRTTSYQSSRHPVQQRAMESNACR